MLLTSFVKNLTSNFFLDISTYPLERWTYDRLSAGISIGRRRPRSGQFGGGLTGPARVVFHARIYNNHRLATGRERAMKETTVEAATDGMSDTANKRKPTAGSRRRTTETAASSPGGRSSTAIAVLSVVAIACSVAAVDLQQAATVCQHWLSTLFQSAGDQQVGVN